MKGSQASPHPRDSLGLSPTPASPGFWACITQGGSLWKSGDGGGGWC